jgi:dynactin-5
MIEDGGIVPPETVVPTFARFAGSPARKIGELPENTADIMVDYTKSIYSHFVPVGPN